MEITVAKSAGFCFGVKRAVECVYKKLENGNIYTYGSIIHNKEVIKDLTARKVKITENLENINDGEIIIRSHGVGPSVYEAIKQKGLEFTDCTCPYVKKIHKIVSSEAISCGIIIIGDKNHPEVIGINGWSGDTSVIIDSAHTAQEYLDNNVFDRNRKYSLVVQTTFQTDIFEEICKILESGLDIKIYNTICSATTERQKEAIDIAKKVDIMIILGDVGSSNTQKLYEISKNYCKKTFLCETINDLELNIFCTNDKIGITAGASTPPAIIKEAVNVMSELELEREDKTFEEMIDGTIVTLHTGAIVKGTVIQVSNGEVSVNLGYKADGIIAKGEFSEDSTVNPEDVVKPGDEIEVFVIRVNDSDGNVQLSKKKIEANKSFVDIEEAFNNKEIVNGKVVDVVKGGLIALIKNIRVFVPSSQISNRFVEDLTVFKGQEFEFNILEYDRSKRRIVAGRKELAQKEYTEMKNKVFESLAVGDKVEGVVSRIVDFGAFVDLGGVDGLIHISELSWGRVKKVKDVLAEGDKVVVTVLDIIKEKGKISLSLKDISNDPWNGVAEKYPVGSIVEGKVVRLVPFGAFVELEEGVDALVHISQIANKHVVKPDDELRVGQIINAKVTEIDLENKKISLSIKETLEKPEPEDMPAAAEPEVEVEEAPAAELEVEAEEAPVEEPEVKAKKKTEVKEEETEENSVALEEEAADEESEAKEEE